MKEPCGCCAGIEHVTPERHANRPGLPAIAYRAGTHPTFLETMLARLSTVEVEVDDPAPAPGTRALATAADQRHVVRPLRTLRTRSTTDPAIALLDAWATVAEVLTFYQERIANEGYLRTATERRSVLELARLIGYEIRPGVAASTYLAFTVMDSFAGDIPAGTRAQSVPGQGELPQFFETSEKLFARDVWNELKPRMTRPQVIVPDGGPGIDPGSVHTLFFKGVTTGLKVGSSLIVVFERANGDGSSKVTDTSRVVRFVDVVVPDAAVPRTAVRLRRSADQRPTAWDEVTATYRTEADALFDGNQIARAIASAFQLARTADDVRTVARGLETTRALAAKRGFIRLAAWLSDLLDDVRSALAAAETDDAGGGDVPLAAPHGLARIAQLLPRLATPPAAQLASAARLQRDVAAVFAPDSDVAPRLLASLTPSAAPVLYAAWGNVEPQPEPARVYAPRVKATLFASTYPGPATTEENGPPTFTNAPVLVCAWNDIAPLADPEQDIGKIALDAPYDQILPGSWVAIERPAIGTDVPARTTVHRVIDARTLNMNTGTGFAAKVTVLDVSPNWLADLMQSRPNALSEPALLRGTIVYAQSEPLELAEEPLDRDVAGDAIELDGLYEGLEPGRWITVSGERTDIPGVAGVTATEPAMIAGVAQGSGTPSCLAVTTKMIPFASIDHVTTPNDRGDRLVIGRPASGLKPWLDTGLAANAFVGQLFCDPLQLAPGVYAEAYVPTAAERAGQFAGFTLKQRFAPDGELFAWRIRRLVSGSERPHTVVTLATPLAYTYDGASVSIRANVVKATHGQTVTEVLGTGDASQALQTFRLHQAPLTFVSAPTAAGAASTLEVRVNDVRWHETGTLAALGAADRGFVTRTDDAGKTSVLFGDGAHGARLPTGPANVVARYRAGLGRPGNVLPGQISQLVTRPPGAKAVVNPLAASGGADADGRDQARRNAPLAVMALDRLVSVQDYADFARTFAGIAKASAARLSDGRRQIVHVTVAGSDDIAIDPTSDLYWNLARALRDLGDPDLPIQLDVRRLRLLILSAGIKVAADYTIDAVAPKVRTAVLDAFGFDRRDLGQSAFASEAIAVMQGVEGVDYVDLRAFAGVSEDAAGDVAQLAQLATTLAANAAVTARLDRVDATGTIQPADLVFMTPDVPSTLLLTEIL